MQVEQANFTTDGRLFRLPVIIPDICSIRTFAKVLHSRGETWCGTFEGWPATYTPEDQMRQPVGSKMTFIPAEFFVGESEIWHIAISWEDGQDAPPVEVENRRGISGESRVDYLDELEIGTKISV
ncbi:hypothetical protein KFU94_23415 [Chloroflexi bacterium TSY]|nr:hypothetical protein [Chloroflexi bacterium TSY]